jgi:hypothetical protein
LPVIAANLLLMVAWFPADPDPDRVASLASGAGMTQDESPDMLD